MTMSEGIERHHAEEWERQIINAGADENIAQQAVALAALNGLFDIHRDWAHLKELAQNWRISSEAIGIHVRNILNADAETAADGQTVGITKGAGNERC